MEKTYRLTDMEEEVVSQGVTLMSCHLELPKKEEDYTIFSRNLYFFFCPCHNSFPLSSVQIIIIPACCLLCVL